MNFNEFKLKHKDLLLRALSTLGMALNLFVPFFGIAFGLLALGYTHKDAKTDWRNPDFYYALLTVLAGIFILGAVITLNARSNNASSSSSI